MNSGDHKFEIPPITFLAFGCNEYDNLTPLIGVKPDIERIKDIFCGSNPYSLFAEKQFIELFNATSKEFRDKINEYIKARGADGDVLFIYFAGHGTAIGRDNFGFCLKDTEILDGVYLPTSVVTIREIISALHIKNIYPIFVLDSCFSGQIAQQLSINFTETSLEINKALFSTYASEYGFLTITDDLAPTPDKKDGGNLSKALEDLIKQGFGDIYTEREYITIAELFTFLIKEVRVRGDNRARYYNPSGNVGDYYIVKNMQYSQPEIPENRYAFTQIYIKILDALWNDGDNLELSPSEILEKTESQSAYGNHRKLSFSPWDLVEDNPETGKRRLTQKGRDFINGKVKIPRVIIVNKETQESRAVERPQMVGYKDI